MRAIVVNSDIRAAGGHATGVGDVNPEAGISEKDRVRAREL